MAITVTRAARMRCGRRRVSASQLTRVLTDPAWRRRSQRRSDVRAQHAPLMRPSLDGIEEYGKSVRTSAVKTLLRNPRSGLFIDSCRHHTKCWSNIVVDEYTPAQAFGNWYRRYVQ
eukprot:1177794-Prorocentrum_minimum.AAC.3